MAQRKDLRLRPGHTNPADVTLAADGASWQDVTLGAGSGNADIGLTPGQSIVAAVAAGGPTTHFGAATMTLVMTVAAAGVPTKFATATTPIVITTATAGAPTKFSSATLPIVISTTTAGTPTKFAAATSPIVIGLTTAGTRTAVASATQTIVINIETNGTVTAGIPNTFPGAWTKKPSRLRQDEEEVALLTALALTT